MNRPQVLGIYATEDAARAALNHPKDPYYRRLGAQVADLGERSPKPELPWGLVVPPPDNKTNTSSGNGS